jgi:serine protease
MTQEDPLALSVSARVTDPMLLAAFALASLVQVPDPAALAPRSPLGVKPLHTELRADHGRGKVELKFAHGSGVRLDAGGLVAPESSAAAGEVEALALYLTSLGAAPKRTFEHDEAWLVGLRMRGEARTGQALHDLALFVQLTFDSGIDVAEVCDTLNSFDVVELAYPLGGASDPTSSPPLLATPPSPTGTPSPAGSSTPDFEPLQEYRHPAPLGIDADYARRFSGASGRGTLIGDIETGWTHDHEDIDHAVQGRYIGLPPTMYPWDHGTATLGEIVGADNGFGVLGIAPDCGALLSSHQGDAGNVPIALGFAVAALAPGDVVMLEVQCYGAAPGYYPCEYVPSTFALVETATANGLHVFSAAGNGGGSLDDPAYGGLFDRAVRDSGAVIVGASEGSNLWPSLGSNYGSRIDLHGWGRGVVTAGYGDLYGTSTHDTYTASFNGTSSATPMVAGAGIVLNGVHRSVFGSHVEPRALRQLLARTGTPQVSGPPIGPRPDLRAALTRLGVPRLELRGDLVPGGAFDVEQIGSPGNPFVILFAPTLRPDPLQMAPFGELFLDQPLRRALGGTLGAGGRALFAGSIPNDPVLTGTTLGHFQGWELFTNGPGIGAFTNYETLTVQ